jgi:hypothetical protein
MSIFSKIGNAIKSAATYTYNTVNSIGSGIKNALSSPSSQVASVGMAFPVGQGLSPSQTATAQKTLSQGGASSNSYNPYNISSGSTGAPMTSIYPGAAAPKLPVTISSGSTGGGGSTTALTSGGQTPLQFYPVQTPRTISSTTLGAKTGDTSLGEMSTLSSFGGGGAATSGSISGGGGTAPLSLASAPTSTNPGGINTTKLAGATAGLYKLKPDGTLEEVKEEKDPVKEAADLFKEYMPKEQSVYDDPQVIQAQKERQRIKEALLAPTNELNAVIAKQNQDLLQLRQTGSQEGQRDKLQRRHSCPSSSGKYRWA